MNRHLTGRAFRVSNCAILLCGILTSCGIEPGLVYDVPNSVYDVYGFSYRDLENHISVSDHVNTGMINRNSRGTQINVGVWSSSGNSLFSFGGTGLTKVDMPAEFSYKDEDDRFVAWYAFEDEYGKDKSNDNKVSFVADPTFHLVANSGFDVDRRGRYFLYEPSEEPGTIRISACAEPATTLMESNDLPLEYLRRKIYSDEHGIYIVSSIRDPSVLEFGYGVTRLHYAFYGFEPKGIVFRKSKFITGFKGLEKYSFVPVDLEPSTGLLLIEVLSWKSYQANPLYLYNLNTDTNQCIGSAREFGMFLARDVLKEFEASQKR